MPKEKIFVIGSGGHARAVIDTIHANENLEIIGVIDAYNIGGECLGYKVLGGIENLKELSLKYDVSAGIVAIGDNFIRQKEISHINDIYENFHFVSVIHKSAIISKNTKIGKGVYVGPGSIINTGSQIGDFTIINTKTSLDHDCTIGEYSSTGPGVTMGGSVNIGNYVHIGIGVNILEKIKIASISLIGAGSLINKNVDKNNVVYGSPAKKIRDFNFGDKYM